MSSGATTLAQHPRHLCIAALAAGLALAGRVELAVVAAALSAAAIVTLVRPASPALIACVVALLPGGAVVGSARLQAIDGSQLTRYAGMFVTVRGYVVRRERESFGVSRVRVKVTTLQPGGPRLRAHELVQLRVRGGSPLRQVWIGDQLEASGELALPHEGSESSGYAAYLRRAGIHTVLHAERVRLTGGRRGGLAGALDAVRRRAERGVSVGLDGPLAALARGMVLGADEDIPDRMSQDFKRSGLAHVLAVSGQNVTLLALLAWPLLGAMRVPRRPRLWAVIALIALYVPLTGAGPSIVRAGAMGVAGTLAALAGRPASRWYALLLAAVVTLAFDPRAWQDAGWQLSFAAVVGIFALSRPLAERLRVLPEPLRSGTALTVAATLATAPLMAFHFERVSLAALPANMAALPAIAPVMWLGMLSAAAAQVSLAPAELMNALNAFCLAHVAAVARWGAALPGSALELRIGSAAKLALFYGGGIAALWLARTGKGRVVLALAALALAALALAGRAPSGPPRHFTATFLDIGQGDATLLQEPGGAAVLVDGGPPGAGVVDKLRDRGVDGLELVVLTHAQMDHEGGLAEVVDSLPVRVLLDGGLPGDGAAHRRIVALARARGASVVRAHAGQRFRVGRDLSMRVLHAADRATADEDPNLRATVTVATFRGFDVFLPADSESDVTGALAVPPVEVLKVAHHGSADPGLTGLLERLRPQIAVIEVGAHNPFGHPHPSTLGALRGAVQTVLRTDRDGDVTITLERGRVSLDRGR